jgi:hypothetical protein
MAIAPAANGALDALNKLTSPATVGAAAGAFAVWKGGDAIEGGLTSISSGFKKVATKAQDAEGLVGKAGSAAESASGLFGTMADVLGGPWGIAAGAALGLLSGLAGSLFSANDATKAVTLSQQDLAKAISQDGDSAGQATAAYIAAQESASGLSDTAQAAGVSTATWTQAVLGNGKAHDQVVAAINKANLAQQQATLSTDEAKRSSTEAGAAEEGMANHNQAAAVAANSYTTANQKLINSLNAQTQQVANTISASTKYEQALNQVDNTQAIFNATLEAGYKGLVANAQSAALTTVGSLNLGTANESLADSLYKTVTAYDTAQAQGSAYNSVLQALNGDAMSAAQAQNTLSQQMLSAKTSFKANKDSLSENTQAGISDREALVSAAQAIQALGVAQYQQTGNINQANKTIQQQIDAFVTATGATGNAKTAIEQYLLSLAKIPPDTKLNVDDSSINSALSATQELIKALKDMPSGTIPTIGSRAVPGHATGGSGHAGEAVVTGDAGRPEVFVPDSDGYIYSSLDAGQRAIDTHNAQVAAAAPAQPSTPGVSSTQGAVVHQYFYGSALPSIEQRANLRREMAIAIGPI